MIYNQLTVDDIPKSQRMKRDLFLQKILFNRAM